MTGLNPEPSACGKEKRTTEKNVGSDLEADVNETGYLVDTIGEIGSGQ